MTKFSMNDTSDLIYRHITVFWLMFQNVLGIAEDENYASAVVCKNSWHVY